MLKLGLEIAFDREDREIQCSRLIPFSSDDVRVVDGALGLELDRRKG